MDDRIENPISMRTHYRNVFSGLSGTIVLDDILYRCGFFNGNLSPDNPLELGRHNMAVEILQILGAYSDNMKRVSYAITEALLRQPVYTPPTITDI